MTDEISRLIRIISLLKADKKNFTNFILPEFPLYIAESVQIGDIFENVHRENRYRTHGVRKLVPDDG